MAMDEEDKQMGLTALKRSETLRRERGEILELPAGEAIESILDAKYPAAIVHSFPEQDFHLLIHETGLNDSLPLLALASKKQLEYILDTEIWDRDRIAIRPATAWIAIFLQADMDRMVEWFMSEKSELIEFFLYNNIEIKIREHDQDPDELGEGFITVDNTLYIKIPEARHEEEEGEPYEEYRKELLQTLIRKFADLDYARYRNILLETMSMIPSEYEEEEFRMRNVRLAEKGFLPFEEAVSIYQHISRRNLRKTGKNARPHHEDPTSQFMVPQYHSGMLVEDSLFKKAIKNILSQEALMQIEMDFAGLCNQVISADLTVIRSRDELGEIVKKACGYLNIGIETIFADDPESTDAVGGPTASEILQRFSLAHIFRAGYSRAIDLKLKAEKWNRESWFESAGLPLNFWGEKWLGVLGGLLIKKPKFFDDYKTGVLYRDFTSSIDVEESEKILDEIIAFDRLFSLMDIQSNVFPSKKLLSYKNLVLTLWLRNFLELPEKPMHVPVHEFSAFFTALWAGTDKPGKISRTMMDSFLTYLSGATRLTMSEITRNMGKAIENLFAELEDEYGSVAEEDIRPEYFQLFLLEE